jgi:hypothetical protein
MDFCRLPFLIFCMYKDKNTVSIEEGSKLWSPSLTTVP